MRRIRLLGRCVGGELVMSGDAMAIGALMMRMPPAAAVMCSVVMQRGRL